MWMAGATARVVSKFKPKTEIIGISPNGASLRRMQIYWGVRPMKSIEVHTTEDICSSAIDLVTAKQIVETGDVVILTCLLYTSQIHLENFLQRMVRNRRVSLRQRSMHM